MGLVGVANEKGFPPGVWAGPPEVCRAITRVTVRADVSILLASSRGFLSCVMLTWFISVISSPILTPFCAAIPPSATFRTITPRLIPIPETIIVRDYSTV